MPRALIAPKRGWICFLVVAFLAASFLVTASIMVTINSFAQSPPQLLTDPFLQLPTAKSVQVVWFTEWEGSEHLVRYGPRLEHTAIATSTRLTRTREDPQSKISSPPATPQPRAIWRHQGTVRGLISGDRVPYQVISHFSQDQSVESTIFNLSSLPSPEQPLKILLTSDHQLKPLVAANLQKVVETIDRVDAVFFAGDLVNVADRASEWFDDQKGCAFFPCLQGKAQYRLKKGGTETVYRGGEIIQNAPLFAAIGNHEVMGRWSETSLLNEQFDDAVPRDRSFNPLDANLSVKKSENSSDSSQNPSQTLKNNSFNTDTYEEIFSLPRNSPGNSPGNSHYYALTYGNIRLIVLYVANMWRSPQIKANVKGRYQEAVQDLAHLERWGHGQHIFEAITPGSAQYDWLQAELASADYAQARYKIVMFHHPPHTLGDNIVPAYSDPVASISRDEQGQIQGVRYDYSLENDHIIRYLMPVLEKAGVDLVFFGHSHLWNRFTSPGGIHFLESSNVGNTYGAHRLGNPRPIPRDRSPDTYRPYGDPNGLDPVIPTISPLLDEKGQPLPYIASNEQTVFSIFDTATGSISSYRFDSREPRSPVIKFDEFALK